MSDLAGHFYLGDRIDSATRERDNPVQYKADRLTTHGLIVGMTGSGKTGLGVILLEEALLQGIPCLIIDPKGDMGNLLLTFPDLAADDFAPWVEGSGAAERSEIAADTAETWKKGLAGWGIGPDRIRALRDRTRFTIYTPGSAAGVPLNLVGGIGASSDSPIEVVRDEIEGYVTGLLGLVGVDADPIASREHVLLANLLERAWDQGRQLDLPGLVAQIQSPPLRKLGVFELETFFPGKERLQLAMRLNGLIASPSFEVWTQGPELDPGELLAPVDGKTAAAIVSIAHLSEEERQFVVTLLLSRMVTWMRSQSGTNDLRALIYMDEVFGYVPPTAEPPTKKPILTILKQARAFGVGMVLSTQNPVDVDYKALSNSGTWMIGRLQTERDKARLMDGLRSASGGVDVDQLDTLISGLGKREFLLHSTKSAEPFLFTTRWAMSYLRGPLAREQIEALSEREGVPQPDDPTAARDARPAPPAISADESPVMPEVADGVPVFFLDPAAPWADEVGADESAKRFECALVARVRMTFDEARAELRHEEEWETVLFPLGSEVDPADGRDVDYDERDLRPTGPDDARFVLSGAPVDKKSWINGVSTALKNHLHRRRTLEIWKNPHLKLYSRAGETKEAFLERCRAAAEDAEDLEAAKLRDRFETKMDRLQVQTNKAEDRVDELEEDTRSRRQQEIVSGVGSLIGVFLGGKSRTRGLATKISQISSRRGQTARTARRLSSAKNRVEELEDAMEELETELADEILAIDARWEEAALDVEPVEVGLEKTDIHVDQVAVVWIPRTP